MAIGPAIALATIKPNVDAAMPISKAFLMPNCFAKVGAHAMGTGTPWPPASETQPKSGPRPS